MESKRAFVEAYISARYPTSQVAGLHAPTVYLTALYPYRTEDEIAYLLDLFANPRLRRLFEKYMLPEIKRITPPERISDAVTRGEEFSIALVRAAMQLKDADLLTWLTDFDTVAHRCDYLHDALGLMHEVMVTVYHQGDLAFNIWFPTAEEYERQQHNGTQQQPVHNFVEQYFLFLHEAARIKNLRKQNKKHVYRVGINMIARKQVNAA